MNQQPQPQLQPPLIYGNMVRYIIDGADFNDYTTITPNQTDILMLLIETY
ncbi:196_t:CDS:1, partial [Ambispora leptoticha]